MFLLVLVFLFSLLLLSVWIPLHRTVGYPWERLLAGVNTLFLWIFHGLGLCGCRLIVCVCARVYLRVPMPARMHTKESGVLWYLDSVLGDRTTGHGGNGNVIGLWQDAVCEQKLVSPHRSHFIHWCINTLTKMSSSHAVRSRTPRSTSVEEV